MVGKKLKMTIVLSLAALGLAGCTTCAVILSKNGHKNSVERDQLVEKSGFYEANIDYKIKELDKIKEQFQNHEIENVNIPMNLPDLDMHSYIMDCTTLTDAEKERYRTLNSQITMGMVGETASVFGAVASTSAGIYCATKAASKGKSKEFD